MNDTPKTLKLAWRAVLMVCKACRHRSKAPKKVKTRDLVAALHRGNNAAMKVHDGDKGRARVRVQRVGCLGLCPKGGVAIVCAGADAADNSGAGAGASLQAVSVTSVNQAEGYARSLTL